MSSAESFSQAVPKTELLRRAAGWRWPDEKSLRSPQLNIPLFWRNYFQTCFCCIHEELIPALPLGEFHSCISQLPSNVEFLYPVLGLYTALENCFLTVKLGVEVNSFTLTARSIEQQKHPEQKWILGVIWSHQMHMSQNCLHKTIDPCFTNLLLFAFYFLCCQRDFSFLYFLQILVFPDSNS